MKVYVLVENRTVINGIHKRSYKFIEGVFANEDDAEKEKKELEEEFQSTEMMHFSFYIEEHELMK